MNTSWQQWTLRHIRGLVEKIEKLEDSMGGLLEENKTQVEQIERMRAFQARTDLQNVAALVDESAAPAAVPTLVLQMLAPFFEGGLLLERQSGQSEQWVLTAFVTRGEYFYLETSERINVEHLVHAMGPDQVFKASAELMLAEIPVPFAHTSRTSEAFMLMPNPVTAFILISDIPSLWREDHVRLSLRLINDAFTP